jgi:[acyl-carrier-protein] S-malonyltransferase
LGEYSALCAAGTVSLADTARLLRIRGNAMQEAVPAGQGSMVALVGATMEQAQTIAKAASEHGICQVANDNGGGQIVLSGATEAIDAAVVLAADHGIRRAVKLPVSAPFHSALMDPAAKVMEEALAAVSFVAPVVPLIANVTAAPTLDPEAIKAQLVEQVSGSVRWRESMEFAASEQVSDLVEIGSGKVLGGLMRRIASDVTSHTLGTPEGIEAFIHLLDAEKAA